MPTAECIPIEIALAAADRTLADPDTSDAEKLIAVATIESDPNLSDKLRHELADLRYLIEREA